MGCLLSLFGFWRSNPPPPESNNTPYNSFGTEPRATYLDDDIARRAEMRRARAREEEREDRERREKFQREMNAQEAAHRRRELEDQAAYEESRRRAEQDRNRLERENESYLVQRKNEIRAQNEKEARMRNEQYNLKNQEMAVRLRAMEEDRKRSADIQNQEINRIREANKLTEERYILEKEETKKRQAREEAELEAELRRMDEENKRARERQRKMWEDRMRKIREQYDYMIKLMAQRQWSMAMERNFDARLNFYRSAGKGIRTKFEGLTLSLITFQDKSRTSASSDEVRFRPVGRRAEELRNALQKQTQVLSDEIANLDSMERKAGWPFLGDIRKSLENVLWSCDEMLQEVESYYTFQPNFDYLKGFTSLQKMNSLYDQMSRAYSQIPTMDVLKNKYQFQAQRGEEHRTDDGVVFIIEEPDD